MTITDLEKLPLMVKTHDLCAIQKKNY